ncbi:MAG: O-methyltransferase [Solirubrobacteraceae bacterium]|jgi:O-methyltransferase|nr:O-methyltransferase [Solirubrobacteraceae bacterium]
MTVEPTQTAAVAAARAAFASARTARVPNPRPEADALRESYLELLKVCLCDLQGSSTVSVGRTQEGSVMSRELRNDQLKLRSAGMDWPLQGLTMVGLGRLDDLQRCVEAVLDDEVPGDLIEAGCWRGGASILMRATLDSHGADDRLLWVADSFRGFPQATALDGDHDDLGAFDFLAVPLDEVRANFARLGCEQNVRFVPGLFEDTLPELGDRRWAIVRLDGDTYDATWVGLASLYPGLSVGGHVIVDDYGALDECREAVDDFRAAHGVTERLEQVDWTCVRWRRESETAIAPAKPPRAARAVGQPAAPAGVPRVDSRVPTTEELAMGTRIAELGERLEAAEREAARLRESPFAGPAAWLHARRKGRRL